MVSIESATRQNSASVIPVVRKKYGTPFTAGGGLSKIGTPDHEPGSTHIRER